MAHSRFIRIAALTALAASLASATTAQTLPAQTCDKLPDEILGVVSELRVNPDGTAASYTVDDHGFTYVTNGLDLFEHGKRIVCSDDVKDQIRCTRLFRAAEAADFGPGTATFCVFAMEVEPPVGGARTPCPAKGSSRSLIGNGLGRLVRGEAIQTITGKTVVPYPSTTALRVRSNGVVTALDSAAYPILVRPGKTGAPLGTVAWIRSGDRSAYAVIGDSGPAKGGYGEGSIALHQLLAYGELRAQAPGPIGVSDRCGPAESAALPRPYMLRPTPHDTCRRGYKPTQVSDVRARRNIPRVEILVLKQQRVPMSGGMIDGTFDQASLETAAGPWKPSVLAGMADCLSDLERAKSASMRSRPADK